MGKSKVPDSLENGSNHDCPRFAEVCDEEVFPYTSLDAVALNFVCCLDKLGEL